MERQWLLESFSTDGARLEFVITHLPCRIGRGKENDLVIANLGLSRIHATVARDIGGQLRLVDENSTNGTFVNRQQIDGFRVLKENDIIHFGSAEFRLRMQWVEQQPGETFDAMSTMLMPANMELSGRFSPNETEFDELIMGHGLSGAVQPIVDAKSRQIVGYELLGRANHPRLPTSPMELFNIAESMDRETDLSLAFRDYGISTFAPRLRGQTLFINVHPKETFSEFFFAWLEQLRRTAPEQSIVAEIHESAVTDTDQLREFATRLAKIGIQFAYDDFGAGRARLLELADVPPHFVKFDMSLIRSLHNATDRKRKVIQDLVQMVLAAGSIPLAEGVENEQEASVCIELGFKLIQGFHTGRPISADNLPHQES